MSINASIKIGKGMNDTSDRLSQMVCNNSRQRRENILKKKRAGPQNSETMDSMPEETVSFQELEHHRQILMTPGNAPDSYVDSVVYFRKLLSSDRHPPIDMVINTGLVPYFADFLKCDNCPNLQYEAAWVLTNISSGTKEQTASVVNSGCLPDLIRLIDSPNSGVSEQATWALGNIAGDSVEYRDNIVNVNGVEIILNHLNSQNCTLLFQKNAVWLLSNLCRLRDGKPADFERVKICLPYMQECLNSDQEDLMIDACWCFAFVTDCNKENTKFVVNEMNALPVIVRLLSSSNVKIVNPALRTVGNVLAGDDVLTQKCIDCNALFYLEQLLNSSNSNITKEATWCISNITAGNEYQIQLILDHSIIPVLVSMIDIGKLELQKEACWAICNAVCGGNIQQILNVMSINGVIDAICKNMVPSSEPKLQMIIIDTLDRCLTVGNYLQNDSRTETNIVKDELFNNGFLDKLESMSLSDEVYTKVNGFIEKYFGYDDDDDEPALPEMN